MKNLITRENKHLLWKDEINDDFLITRYGEIYRYSDKLLCVTTWAVDKYNKILKEMEGEHHKSTDDGLRLVFVRNKYLPALLKMSKLKQRPTLKGKWLEWAKEKLGHDIIPYRPALKMSPTSLSEGVKGTYIGGKIKK